jgi:hypothetical protein
MRTSARSDWQLPDCDAATARTTIAEPEILVGGGLVMSRDRDGRFVLHAFIDGETRCVGRYHDALAAWDAIDRLDTLE